MKQFFPVPPYAYRKFPLDTSFLKRLSREGNLDAELVQAKLL